MWCSAKDGEVVESGVGVCAQVCQHHAAAVAHGSGCGQILRCSYHGWEYGGLQPVASVAMSNVKLMTCLRRLLAQHH